MVAFLERVLSGLDCLDCIAEKGGKPESKGRAGCYVAAAWISCAARSRRGETRQESKKREFSKSCGRVAMRATPCFLLITAAAALQTQSTSCYYSRATACHAAQNAIRACANSDAFDHAREVEHSKFETNEEALLDARTAYALLFNVGSGNEGIYSRRLPTDDGGLDLVVTFEDEDDANRYAGMLEADDFPEAVRQ